jgi:eukaryotic-like serine/threonine-protein kinase
VSLPAGTTLGPYEIVAPLGAGGMGVVYRARDQKLGRTVAVKVLSGDFSSDSQRTRRFEQEARAASALNHSNVCVVYALGETPDGQPFIAMEYIEGHTLRRVLQTRPPSLRGVLDIAIQIAAGVGAAHAIGIVHRDLKPENVLLRDDGVAKVVDFGLAKLAAGGLPSDVPEATHTLLQTDAGLVMGTFTYMAPEQARGVDVDARADIWALGVMLYEMVSGHAPFSGETRSDVLAAILEREPPPLDRVDPRIPHELQRIVAKALRKDRAQRYQTITDLRLDLEALRSELQVSSSEAAASAGAPVPAVSTSPPMRRESSAEFLLTGLGRHKIATAASLLALVAMVVLAASWIRRSRSTPTSGGEAPAQAHRNLTRLTFGEGLQTDPTFSPDGRFIAYASDRAGNFDIWVQPVAGGDPVQVTKSPAPDTRPAWSPDGSTIVFRSERDGGGLYRVPALGGQEQQLAPFGVHPTWSKDGAAVFFLVGPSLDSGEGPARFYTVALDGSPPRELGSKFLADGTWRWIAPHPDGRISAAGTHATRGRGFFTFSDDGTGVILSAAPAKPNLIGGSAFERMRFQWNLAGTRLYVEATENALENLWRVQIDPLTLEWRSVERLTTDAASDVAAALSRDESRLAFTQRSVTARLWAFPFDASAGRLVALTAGSPGAGKPITDPSGVPQAFSLSPDGNWLASTLVRPGTAAAELSVTNIDSGKTEFLSGGGFASAWSTDGRRVAFAKFQQGRSAVFVRDLGAPEEHQISPWSAEQALLPTCWTPDGRAVVVSVSSSTADNTPMWLWAAAGGTDKPARVLLEQRGINFWQGQLSPNGRWLAFVPEKTADPGRGRIAIAPAEGAPPERWTYIAPESPWADKPRWAPDGRALYFIAKGPGGYFNLTAQRFDPDRGTAVGLPVTLTRFDSPSLFISPFVNRTEIGIAAHRAVLTMQSISGSVWMLDGVDR